MRQLLCSLLALAIFASAGLSADKKKKKKKPNEAPPPPALKEDPAPAGDASTIKSIDAEKGTLTVTKDGKDSEVAIGDDTKVITGTGEEKMGKDGLKSDKLKEGAQVKITKDGDKIVSIQLVK